MLPSESYLEIEGSRAAVHPLLIVNSEGEVGGSAIICVAAGLFDADVLCHARLRCIQ